jgi:hypothetical protein
MKKGFVAIASLFLVVLAVSAYAYPQPAVVQGVRQWTLNVEYSQPEQLMLRSTDGKTSQRFWYIILTVTNNSDFDEVAFYPACELMTDTFKIIPADRHVPRTVFETIKKLTQGRYPFLESLDFVDHRVFRGEDNSRDIAIIWPDFDPQAREISLFIGGLSNETAVVEKPAKQEPDTEPVILQKTLQLRYAIGGDPQLRQNAVLREIDSTWVMR